MTEKYSKEQVRARLREMGSAEPSASLINGWHAIVNNIKPQWLADSERRQAEKRSAK